MRSVTIPSWRSTFHSLPGTLGGLALVVAVLVGPHGPTGSFRAIGGAAEDSTTAVVRAALQALGGGDFIKGAPGVRLRIMGTRRWEGQGKTPDDPTDVHSLTSEEVVIPGVGVYQRYEQARDGEVDWCLETRGTATEAYQYDCLARVLRPLPAAIRARLVRQGGGRQVRAQVASLLDPGVTLTWIRRFDTAGRHLRQIRETPRQGPARIWTFDGATDLPWTVASVVPTTLGEPGPIVTTFEDYRRVGDATVPFVTRVDRPGDLSDVRRITSIEPAESLPPSRSARPSGVVEGDTLRAPPPRIVDIGAGTVVVEDVVQSYNSLVTDLGDGLVVFEAPGGDARSAAVLRLMAERFPDRPVRYLVLTHFHHDHIAGLAEYVRRGATVLTTAGNVRWLDALLGRSIGAPAPGGAPRVRAVQDGEHLGQGSSRVVLRVIDGSPHVDQMILGYLPASGTLFVSDLFFLEGTGQVRPADRGRAAFATVLPRLGIRIDRLAGGHGGLAALSDLEASVALRRSGVGVDPPLTALR